MEVLQNIVEPRSATLPTVAESSALGKRVRLEQPSLSNSEGTREFMLSAIWQQVANAYDEEDDYSSDDSEESPSDDESETATAKALVKVAFSRNLSTPDLAKLVMRVSNTSKSTASIPVTGIRPRKKPRFTPATGMVYSESAPCLGAKTTPQQLSSYTSLNSEPIANPEDLLRKLFDDREPTKPEAFSPPTTSAIANYTLETVHAARNDDLKVIQKVVEGKESFDCRNKFGESILHIVCRQGHVEVLKFLLRHMSPLVCCDYGRTILHDACWTSTQNFAVMDLILRHAPDLLYVRDKRGFTPLQYVPKNQWGAWNSYLRRPETAKLLGGKKLET